MRNPNPARINKIPKIEINKITLLIIKQHYLNSGRAL